MVNKFKRRIKFCFRLRVCIFASCRFKLSEASHNIAVFKRHQASLYFNKWVLDQPLKLVFLCQHVKGLSKNRSHEFYYSQGDPRLPRCQHGKHDNPEEKTNQNRSKIASRKTERGVRRELRSTAVFLSSSGWVHVMKTGHSRVVGTTGDFSTATGGAVLSQMNKEVQAAT